MKFTFCSLLITFIFFHFSVFAQQVPDFLQGIETKIQKPLELRDPFKRHKRKSVITTPPGSKLDQNNSFTNRPSIGARPLSDIRIVAVFLGQKRRAIAKISLGGSLSEESYTLKEGDKLGNNQAEIKAIVPGGIILVEKIKNIYDQEEYIETILPVSSSKSQ